ncbi:talihypothetical protein [Limosa lapponica baueri]|uniref:Uncharacterized protein n=1 Tax=Limosa lapponica baueri TaxID=1758121 RepID=A0A2I0T532_LIMLA|nr:talihypothetical protein [Limosa lapponica baueri]
MLGLLSLSFRDKAPGQRECDFSIDGINRCIRDIEQASLAAVSQSLATRDDISVELDEGTPPDPKGTFVDYQTTVVKYSKAIAVTAQEMG